MNTHSYQPRNLHPAPGNVRRAFVDRVCRLGEQHYISDRSSPFVLVPGPRPEIAEGVLLDVMWNTTENGKWKMDNSGALRKVRTSRLFAFSLSGVFSFPLSAFSCLAGGPSP